MSTTLLEKPPAAFAPRREKVKVLGELPVVWDGALLKPGPEHTVIIDCPELDAEFARRINQRRFGTVELARVQVIKDNLTIGTETHARGKVVSVDPDRLESFGKTVVAIGTREPFTMAELDAEYPDPFARCDRQAGPYWHSYGTPVVPRRYRMLQDGVCRGDGKRPQFRHAPYDFDCDVLDPAAVKWAEEEVEARRLQPIDEPNGKE